MKLQRFFRFSLGTLLAALTLAALGLGLERWHRKQTEAECLRLAGENIELEFDDIGPPWLRRFVDADFWLSQPVKATITVPHVEVDQFNIGWKNLPLIDAQAALLELKPLLDRMGVRDVRLEILPVPGLTLDYSLSAEENVARSNRISEQNRALRQFAVDNGLNPPPAKPVPISPPAQSPTTAAP